jgi:glycosyltransferase involved in cell wall biosynthesis
MTGVSVALPVRNGAAHLRAVLAAVRAQRVDRPVEIVIVDSGSTDGSVEIARDHGARVEEIPPVAFSHGATRNRLMELARGDHVAFLTQDAEPADDRWLARLLDGFALAEDVALTCGPYRPRPDASPMVARELESWFAGFTADGRPRVDRAAAVGPGPATFFSSANGCVARAAWRRVPFRPVPYAEDQQLAIDMLRAGYAKVFLPDAAVLHSHDYAPQDGFRRVFDEFRALRELYGFRAPLAPRPVAGRIRREVAHDRAWARRRGLPDPALPSLRYHAVRALGAGLGTRADRLPPGLRRRLSLERRATFEPTHQA